jgi:hypothetical protein
VPRLNLREINDLVTIEHRHIGRLAELVDEPGQVRPRPNAQHARRGVTEADELGTENVLPRRLLANVAKIDERTDEPMNSRQREPGGGSQLRQTHHPARISHHLEQPEGPLDRLHTPGPRLPACYLCHHNPSLLDSGCRKFTPRYRNPG